MKGKLLKWIETFNTGISTAEWAWKILVSLIVLGGTSTTALLAKTSVLFEPFGIVVWIFIGLFSGVLISIIFYLINRSGREVAEANLKGAETEIYRNMLKIPSNINPLESSFQDEIIKLEDLRLPGNKIHENKHFTRCNFVGPGALGIIGGIYTHNGFHDLGTIVVVPDKAQMPGIVIFKNCTVDHCEFFRVSVFTNVGVGNAFQEGGFPVVGLPS